MVAGREASPKDVEDTERLMRYWSVGEGGAKIQWFAEGAFDRCKAELGKYVEPGIVSGLCANLAKRATGLSPSSNAYLVSHGHKPHGDNGHHG